jgi:hypothetical protein
VFAEPRLQRIGVTYDGSVMNFYREGVQQARSLRLSPGVALTQHVFDLSGLSRWTDTQPWTEAGTFLYYGVVFIPIGFGLARPTRSLHMTSFRRTLSMAFGTFVCRLSLMFFLLW